jgi:hypothetical protein
LAIDIGDFDLFTSIYKSAKLAKNSDIARAAKEKADEMSDDLDSDSSSSEIRYQIFQTRQIQIAPETKFIEIVFCSNFSLLTIVMLRVQ